MDEIKKQIEYKVYWIRIDQKKMCVLAKGNSKKETKNEIKNLIDGLNNAIINRVIIKFHDDQKVYNHGVMSFHINNYKIIHKKLEKINLDNKDGYVWFEKDWLLKNGWDKKYISNTLQLLRENKGKIVIPGINYYYFLGIN